ncbi:uncharacterized protein LOC129809350 [Phlebotomus papatasi]|uniref:uncharacterized protein LOC129809350 n=1 Tax=Phlebotomus papatasi TaxID=29031 RepID=UPI0024840478|nr:uncharacterized protein LOC129809350 [Phlebotomus papatasi]
MSENFELRFFEEVPDRELNRPAYYLHHHAVLKSSGKIRVVMNASSKSQTGLSLNDVAMMGPTVQPDIVEILLRFRLHEYAFTSDIEKMYPQILIHPPHRDFHRILWRSTTTEPIKHYRARGVCFGVTSSPFLAMRVLNDLAEQDQATYPLASELLTKSFYVDDCLSSVPTIQMAQQSIQQLQDLLASAGMKLAKWNSNEPIIVESLSTQPKQEVPTSSSTLGMTWHSLSDHFQFQLSTDFTTARTKREVLAWVASLYDPLGLIGPTVVYRKLIIQRLWKENVGWDHSIPDDILVEWNRYAHALPAIKNLTVPRWISGLPCSSYKEIHVFTDASSYAYGTVAYAVTENNRGQIMSRILMAKSRVALTDPPTIPRLELCAAVLGARVLEKIRKSFLLLDYHLWTDSTIVLGQIRSKRTKLDAYILNRITEIQALTDVHKWNHVPTDANPADIISRGMYPVDLLKSSLWWNGPQFITHPVSQWPIDPSRGIPAPLAVATISDKKDTHPIETILTRHNGFHKVTRILAYILRISSKTKPTSSLTPLELVNAERKLISYAPLLYFSASAASSVLLLRKLKEAF